MSESIVSTVLGSLKRFPQEDYSIMERATHLQVLHPVLTFGLLVLRRLDFTAKLTGTQPRPAPVLLSGEAGLLELRGCGELIAEGVRSSSAWATAVLAYVCILERISWV